MNQIEYCYKELGGRDFPQISNRDMWHQWFLNLSPYIEDVFVFETFPKACQFHRNCLASLPCIVLIPNPKPSFLYRRSVVFDFLQDTLSYCDTTKPADSVS